MQSDKVHPDALFSSEVVGAIVAVLQQSPAERRAGRRTTGVARTSESEQAAGSTQTLWAGIVVIQKALRREWQESFVSQRPAYRQLSFGFTLNRHADIVKVTIVGLVPCLKVPLRNILQAIFIWHFQSHKNENVKHMTDLHSSCINLSFISTEEENLRWIRNEELIFEARVWRRFTDVAPCCQVDQVSPLHHLGFVLEVGEIVGDASHQFKAWKPIKNRPEQLLSHMVISVQRLEPGWSPFIHKSSISWSSLVKSYWTRPAISLQQDHRTEVQIRPPKCRQYSCLTAQRPAPAASGSWSAGSLHGGLSRHRPGSTAGPRSGRTGVPVCGGVGD